VYRPAGDPPRASSPARPCDPSWAKVIALVANGIDGWPPVSDAVYSVEEFIKAGDGLQQRPGLGSGRTGLCEAEALNSVHQPHQLPEAGMSNQLARPEAVARILGFGNKPLENQKSPETPKPFVSLICRRLKQCYSLFRSWTNRGHQAGRSPVRPMDDHFGGYRAFHPDPLPPVLNWSPQMASALADARC